MFTSLDERFCSNWNATSGKNVAGVGEKTVGFAVARTHNYCLYILDEDDEDGRHCADDIHNSLICLLSTRRKKYLGDDKIILTY